MKAALTYIRATDVELQSTKHHLSRYGIAVSGVISRDNDQAIRVFGQDIVWAPWRLRGGHKWAEYFNEDLYDKTIGLTAEQALPLVERASILGPGSILSSTQLMIDFSVALEFIEQAIPELVMFSKAPESAIEYSLYRIAQARDLPCMMTLDGIFTHSRLVVGKYESPIVRTDGQLEESVFNVGNLPDRLSRNRLVSQDIEEIKNAGTHEFDCQRSSRLNHANELKDDRGAIAWIRSKLVPGAIRESEGWRRRKLKNDLYREYTARSIRLVEKPKGSFVCSYFLHYQPELTTMPLGNAYVNQIRAIKTLSQSLPDKSTLLVKEHPAVFAPMTKPNSRFRSRQFYAAIDDIPGVSLVDSEVPSRTLIRMSDLTSSVTGTVGLESLIMGTPTLPFGYASYRNVYGSIDVSLLRDLPDSVLELANERVVESSTRFIDMVEAIAFHPEYAAFDLKSPFSRNDAALLTAVERYLA